MIVQRNMVPTAMGLAFVNAVPRHNGGAFTSHVVEAVKKGSGMKSKPSLELHLSKKTSTKLGLNKVF